MIRPTLTDETRKLYKGERHHLIPQTKLLLLFQREDRERWDHEENRE